METDIIRLNLLSPLHYIPGEDPEPFNYREGSGEKLFCFELDEAQFRSIEPDRKKLLGKLVFGGAAAGTVPGEGRNVDHISGEKPEELPPGNYLFAQKREILGEDKIIDLAVEIQQEGLWQRLLPERRLYLRYLFEDGRGVTQLFRPYTK